MADTSNLSQFLTDIADAIRTKKETTEPIAAEQFDQEILSIETGASVKLFATKEEMLSDDTAKTGDYAMVYSNNSLTGLYEAQSKIDNGYLKFTDVSNVTFSSSDVTITEAVYDKTVSKAKLDELFVQIADDVEASYYYGNVGYDIDDNLVITVMLNDERKPNGCSAFVYDTDNTFLGMGTPIGSSWLSDAPSYTLDVFTIDTKTWTYTKRRANNLGYRKTSSSGSTYVVVFDFKFKTYPYYIGSQGTNITGSSSSTTMRVVKANTMDKRGSKTYYDNEYGTVITWVPIKSQLTLANKLQLNNGVTALGSQEIIQADNVSSIKYFTSIDAMNAYSPEKNDKCVVVENNFATLYLPEATDSFQFSSVPSIVRKNNNTTYYAKSSYTKATDTDVQALKQIYSLLYTNKATLYLDGACNFIITKVDDTTWNVYSGQDVSTHGDTIMPQICINGRGTWAAIYSGSSSSNKLPFVISVNLSTNKCTRTNLGRNEDYENDGASSTKYYRYLGYKFQPTDKFFLVTSSSLTSDGAFSTNVTYKCIYYNGTVYDFYTSASNISIPSVYKWKQALEEVFTVSDYDTALETAQDILGKEVTE